MATSEGPVTTQEMIEVCEDIIRNGRNAQARLTAMKQLRELKAAAGEELDSGAAAADAAPADGFAALDEVGARRRRAG